MANATPTSKATITPQAAINPKAHKSNVPTIERGSGRASLWFSEEGGVLGFAMGHYKNCVKVANSASRAFAHDNLPL
jgi:hypothetical protein